MKKKLTIIYLRWWTLNCQLQNIGKRWRVSLKNLCFWPKRLMKSNNVILYTYEALMSIPWILPVILSAIPFKKDVRVGQGPEKSSWHDQGDRWFKRLRPFRFERLRLKGEMREVRKWEYGFPSILQSYS